MNTKLQGWIMFWGLLSLMGVELFAFVAWAQIGAWAIVSMGNNPSIVDFNEFMRVFLPTTVAMFVILFGGLHLVIIVQKSKIRSPLAFVGEWVRDGGS